MTDDIAELKRRFPLRFAEGFEEIPEGHPSMHFIELESILRRANRMDIWEWISGIINDADEMAITLDQIHQLAGMLREPSS